MACAHCAERPGRPGRSRARRSLARSACASGCGGGGAGNESASDDADGRRHRHGGGGQEVSDSVDDDDDDPAECVLPPPKRHRRHDHALCGEAASIDAQQAQETSERVRTEEADGFAAMMRSVGGDFAVEKGRDASDGARDRAAIKTMQKANDATISTLERVDAIGVEFRDYLKLAQAHRHRINATAGAKLCGLAFWREHKGQLSLLGSFAPRSRCRTVDDRASAGGRAGGWRWLWRHRRRQRV